jgi:hypothetical protein
MSPKRFANFFENTDADKCGISRFYPSLKTSQKLCFLDFSNQLTNFLFLSILSTHISSASAKTKKPQKFANQTLHTKSKPIYELFKKQTHRENKPSSPLATHQLSKSEIKKDMICELLDKTTIKAVFKRVLVKIQTL